jgi:hypothetical protein
VRGGDAPLAQGCERRAAPIDGTTGRTDASLSDAITSVKAEVAFGRGRSPIELVLVEILRVHFVERRFRRFVGGGELATVEAAL